jgi:hypothetical protein
MRELSSGMRLTIEETTLLEIRYRMELASA